MTCVHFCCCASMLAWEYPILETHTCIPCPPFKHSRVKRVSHFPVVWIMVHVCRTNLIFWCVFFWFFFKSLMLFSLWCAEDCWILYKTDFKHSYAFLFPDCTTSPPPPICMTWGWGMDTKQSSEIAHRVTDFNICKVYIPHAQWLFPCEEKRVGMGGGVGDWKPFAHFIVQNFCLKYAQNWTYSWGGGGDMLPDCFPAERSTTTQVFPFSCWCRFFCLGINLPHPPCWMNCYLCTGMCKTKTLLLLHVNNQS